jgi:hypothetical protein
VIPDDCRDACKGLLREVTRRNIQTFRNTFVGHIWDKEKNRPLTEDEIEAAANTIVEGDEEAFVAWCNDVSANEFPNTVVSIVEHTRDRILEKYEL